MSNEVTISVIVLAVVNVALAVAVTIHAVLWKRDSRAVIGWVGLAWLTPLVGTVAYVILGINRIQRKAASLDRRRNMDRRQLLPAQTRHQLEEQLQDYPNLEGMITAGNQLTGMPITSGNEVTPLVDGDEAYPAMLSAIEKAEKSVGLLSYIFDSDRAGDAFVKALVDAYHRGVQVRVLIDDVGSKYSRPNMVRRLQAYGLKTASFLPTRIPFPFYANIRNHRKILVVDGQIGFTGGTNIREGHQLQLEPDGPVQCLHFQLRGPVVAQLQHVFADDWEFATGENLQGEPWFPPCSHVGTVWARGIEHGPDEHFETMADVIAAALATARKQVRIVTPYFLPQASLIQALNVTAMRGVDVQIYMPSANNIAIVQWAATAQLWQMLEKQCRIFYLAPPFDHSKLMVVDGIWSLIGSTNWDPRSLRLNFEFNVECYDESFARTLNEIIDRKAEPAREITLEEVNSRSFPTRLRDGLARLFTPYL